MTWMFHALAILGGAALPVQVGFNAQLRTHLGHPLLATLVSFAVGTVTALAYYILARYPWPAAQAARAIPWWGWLGGSLGVFYVWTTVMAGPRLGAAITLALVVVGQLTCAMILDHFGALGLPVRPITALRVVGIALVIVGVTVLAADRG